MEYENKAHGFDPKNLWERYCVVDPGAGEIVILVPITVGRVRDTERSTKYYSSISVHAQGIARNVQFEIPAGSLEEALGKWMESATEASRKFFEELESARIKASLAVPASASFPPKIAMN